MSVIAMKWLSIAEEATSIRTIHEVRSDSCTDFTKLLNVMSFFKIHKASTAKAPTPPASVGVKIPYMSPPTSRRNMIRGHIILGSVFRLSVQGYFSLLGPILGLILHQPK